MENTVLTGPGSAAGEADRVLQYLIQNMLDGSLSAGSRLPTERALAQELGVSRNSTREAISTLHGMGLIDRHQGSGNYISTDIGPAIGRMIRVMLALKSFTRADICGFRRALDQSACALLFLPGAPKPDGSALSAAAAAMQTDSLQAFIDSDRAFHAAFIHAAGNQLLTTVMDAVSGVYSDCIEDVLRSADKALTARLCQIHKDIADAVQNGDPAALQRAIDEHYNCIEEVLK